MKVITGKGRVQIMRLHHNIILQKCHPEMYMHSIWKVTNKYIAMIEVNMKRHTTPGARRNIQRKEASKKCIAAVRSFLKFKRS